jgi:hypothetical protein
MTDQPIPTVTDADVDQVVRRDFPPYLVDEVLALLLEYGAQSWEREAPRVRLAVLKLSGGDPDSLSLHLAVARLDYRDVLAHAEYPGYFTHVSPGRSLPKTEIQRIIDEDWKQYQDWLKRS